jgi:TRAP-type C4-dicarboxylate transport system permease small subunit
MRYVNIFEVICTPLAMALMAVIIVCQVFFRYVIAYSLDWPEELGRYLFIISVYLGAAYAERYDKHLAITILRESRIQVISRAACLADPFFTVIFSIIMTVWGIQMSIFVYDTQQMAPAMQFPMFYIYTVMPLATFFMGLHAGMRFFRILGARHQKD